MSEMSCPRPTSTSNPELRGLRRLVQSQAAQIKILQDQLYQYRTSPEQQEEPELVELVTAEHHRAFMTICGVDSQN